MAGLRLAQSREQALRLLVFAVFVQRDGILDSPVRRKDGGNTSKSIRKAVFMVIRNISEPVPPVQPILELLMYLDGFRGLQFQKCGATSVIPDYRFQIRIKARDGLESGIWNLESAIWDLRSRWTLVCRRPMLEPYVDDRGGARRRAQGRHGALPEEAGSER